MNGAMTCGAFSAMPEKGTKSHAVWTVTCTWLPGWTQQVIGSESQVADAIMRLQAEYRKESK